MRTSHRLLVATSFVAVVVAAPFASAKHQATDIEPDAKAVKLLEGMVKAIQANDTKAMVPFCHESMLDGDDLQFNLKKMLRIKGRKVAGVEEIKVIKAERIVATGEPHRFGRFETKEIDRYQFEGAGGKKVLLSMVWVDGAPKAVSLPL